MPQEWPFNIYASFGENKTTLGPVLRFWARCFTSLLVSESYGAISGIIII